MRELGGGSIINLSSIAWRAGAAEMVAYAAAKAGIIGLTRALARRLRRRQHPRQRHRARRGDDAAQRRLWYRTEEAVETMVRRQSLHTTLLGEEIARTALFLAADDSRMITKQAITVRRRDTVRRAMLHVGLNPYGLTYHLGLQGRGTPRANPAGAGLDGFLAIAQEIGARTLEIYDPGWSR